MDVGLQNHTLIWQKYSKLLSFENIIENSRCLETFLPSPSNSWLPSWLYVALWNRKMTNSCTRYDHRSKIALKIKVLWEISGYAGSKARFILNLFI